jgi:predicted N-acetyltransferase YhbS
MAFRLAHLADHPEHVDTIAAWWHDEWGAVTGLDLDGWREAARRQLQTDAIPLGLVALDDGGALLGAASLVDQDASGFPPARPRLANVYVPPEHRRRGLGSALTEGVAAEAVRLGVADLFLYTNSQERLYARLGWRTVKRFTLDGWGPSVVMVRNLGAP